MYTDQISNRNRGTLTHLKTVKVRAFHVYTDPYVNGGVVFFKAKPIYRSFQLCTQEISRTLIVMTVVPSIR